jgi:hypothetical protein
VDVEIDHSSEASRRAAARAFDLALARRGGTEAYATVLEDVLLPIFNEPDLRTRAQATADLVDGAVSAIFALLSFFSREVGADPADIALVIERAIDRIDRGGDDEDEDDI